MCGDLGYVKNYRILANGQSVVGFIYHRDEPAFLVRHPEAIRVSDWPCECQGKKRVERLFGHAGIPKHREHCTWQWFDDQPLRKQAGKEEARNLAEEFANQGTLPYPFTGGLVLRGSTGMGKSALAACIARERLAAGVAVMWIDLNEFLNECYRAQERMFAREKGDDDSPANPYQFVDAVSNSPFLVIDDFGDMKRVKSVTDYQRDKVYDVIRARYEHELPSVITTNLTDQQMIDQFGPRIAERIGESWRWVEMTGEYLRFNTEVQEQLR